MFSAIQSQSGEVPNETIFDLSVIFSARSLAGTLSKLMYIFPFSFFKTSSES